jgi:hypothetical protein
VIGSGDVVVAAGGVVVRSRSWRSLEEARVPADISDRRRESTRKIPPHHQLMRVSRVTDCRLPSTLSVVPPPSEASPPPCPAWSRTTVASRSASRIRRADGYSC